MSRSFRDLERSRAVSGPALESFAHAAKRKVTLDIKVKNVWGVKVPEIEETTLTRSVEARDVSPVGERADVMDVASALLRGPSGRSVWPAERRRFLRGC